MDDVLSARTFNHFSIASPAVPNVVGLTCFCVYMHTAMTMLGMVTMVVMMFVVLQIDMKKMPLGKLSKRQIQSAYRVLTELNQVN